MNTSTAGYWHNIHKTAECIQNADTLLIGVGAGMTASGGLNYADPVLAEKWYPEYFKAGKRSIIEILSDFWPNTINEHNAAVFWGFWARHIYHIRYEPGALPPYRFLYDLVKDKDFFLCATNVDGQLEKAGFDAGVIFAPQGNYALFQCEKPCSQDVYNNAEMIKAMIENMVSPFEICPANIPRCPKCGKYLIPNLRCDDSFVETPHVKNMERYKSFIQNSYEKRLCLLELGVGFNTPVIIRYPFEAITLKYPHATLIRVNTTDAAVSEEYAEKSVCIREDIGKVLIDIREVIRE